MAAGGDCKGWEEFGAEEQLGELLDCCNLDGGWQQEGNVGGDERFGGGGAAR